MESRMLQPGDLMPHFEVTTLQGEAVAYSTIWQRRNLVLVTLRASDSDGPSSTYVAQLTDRGLPVTGDDTRWVITRDMVERVPSPGVVVADRWGEIVLVAAGSKVSELPSADEIVEWVTYVQHQCPECEGEAR